MVSLRPITEEDFSEIKTWPSYEHEFEQMDYALRQGGWLDEYKNRAETRIYLAESDKRSVGFTLLSITATGEAKNAVSPFILTGQAWGWGERSRLQSLK